MDADEIRYWEAAVQLIPVVTLAVVIEARAVSRHWTQKTPTWTRMVDGSMWLAVMVGLAICEYAALRALRTGKADEDTADATLNMIVLAFTVLVAVPAVELGRRGYAEIYAWMFSRHPRARLTVFFIKWDLRKMMKEREKDIADVEQLQIEIHNSGIRSRQLLDRLERERADLAAIPHPSPNDLARLKALDEYARSAREQVDEVGDARERLSARVTDLMQRIKHRQDESASLRARADEVLRKTIESDYKRRFGKHLPKAPREP